MVLRENIAIIFALVLSMGLHLLILPIVYSKKPPMTYLPPAKATHLETPRVEKPKIELGIDHSKESTLTWIGYEEYEEQRARFAEVEQASMKTKTEVAKPTAFSMPSFQQMAIPVAEMASQLLEALQGIEISTPAKEVPVIFPEVEVIEEPTLEPVEVVEEVPVDGNPSDRDSDATSVIKISPDQWRSGKPLASQGIVLRPRRPSFTANQLVINAPSDLVAELHIDRRGKPQDVVILFSTGSPSIDRSLESSLYRWRASGDQIDALEDEETLNITIHITFSK
jgi:hypothetical protein